MHELLSSHKLNFDKLHELGLPKNIIELDIKVRVKEPVVFTVKYYPTDADGRPIIDELLGEFVSKCSKFELV